MNGWMNEWTNKKEIGRVWGISKIITRSHILCYARIHRAQHIIALMANFFFNDTIRLHSRSLREKDTLGRVQRNLPTGFLYFPSQPRRGHSRYVTFSTGQMQCTCVIFLLEKPIGNSEFRVLRGRSSHVGIPCPATAKIPETQKL